MPHKLRAAPRSFRRLRRSVRRLWVIGAPIAAQPVPIAAIATWIAPQLAISASLVEPIAPNRGSFGRDRRGLRVRRGADCADRPCSRVARHADCPHSWLRSPRSVPLAPKSARPPRRSPCRARRSPRVARQNPRVAGRSPVRAGLSSRGARRSPHGRRRSPLSLPQHCSLREPCAGFTVVRRQGVERGADRLHRAEPLLRLVLQ